MVLSFHDGRSIPAESVLNSAGFGAVVRPLYSLRASSPSPIWPEFAYSLHILVYYALFKTHSSQSSSPQLLK